jgi:hypothetical protein
MKKFTIAAVILFATACLFSCSKTSDSCTGTILLTSTSTNPYQVVINGAITDTIQGGGALSVNEATGTYTVEVKQLSGYGLLKPTIEVSQPSVTCGNTSNIIFP